MTGVREDERLARVALSVISEPGDPRLARLVAALGPVELLDRLGQDTDLSGLRSETAARLAGLDPRATLASAQAAGIRFLVPGDPEWPPGLDDLAVVSPLNGMTGAPLGLWVRGPLDLADLSRRAVAVVGSRSATSYGTDVAGLLASTLVKSDVGVVSGAAFGIDQAAHRGALSGDGPTVAVLACGVDRPYPAAAGRLLDHLAQVGAVVSELPPGCAPTRVRFLSRNRLIAAMTVGTVVVEAAVRSGALNTASWAARLNRVLMAVPGPVTSAPSEGVHELVRSGSAALVCRAEHVLELIGTSGEALFPVPRAPVTSRDRLDPQLGRLLEAVPLRRPAVPEAIARTAGLDLATVRAGLAQLSERGWVVSTDGHWCRAACPPPTGVPVP